MSALSFHDFLRTMAKSFPCHVDLMLVVGLQNQPHVDLQHLVAADQRPAAATGQHFALKFRSFEAAAVKVKDASAAIGGIAETGHLNFEGDRKQKLSTTERSDGLLPSRRLPVVSKL